jgi:hypothetical protein
MKDNFEELASLIRKDNMLKEVNSTTLDYETFMSYMNDSIKSRYNFLKHDNTNCVTISDNSKISSSDFYITIPIDKIYKIEEKESTIELYTISKFVLNIWKNTNLLSVQIF